MRRPDRTRALTMLIALSCAIAAGCATDQEADADVRGTPEATTTTSTEPPREDVIGLLLSRPGRYAIELLDGSDIPADAYTLIAGEMLQITGPCTDIGLHGADLAALAISTTDVPCDSEDAAGFDRQIVATLVRVGSAEATATGMTLFDIETGQAVVRLTQVDESSP